MNAALRKNGLFGVSDSIEQEDQWIREITQEAHQGRLVLLSANLVRPNLLQARIGFRFAQPAQLRSKVLQNGIGIGTRLFQQFSGMIRPVPARMVTWGLRCDWCLL